jgi:hypothetical protein
MKDRQSAAGCKGKNRAKDRILGVKCPGRIPNLGCVVDAGGRIARWSAFAVAIPANLTALQMLSRVFVC